MLKGLHHYEDPQSQMTDGEVMTTAIIAALYFVGNFEKAREMLAEQGHIPHMLSKSRFNRRSVTPQGFELKVALFVLAASFNALG
jgi:hypothetical protein